MKNFNFLSKSSSQSCGHSSVTLASTVGSPSAHRRGNMLKLISVLVLVLTFGVGNVWATDPDHSFNESWSFSTSGNTNWSSINCNSYCGGWGKNKDASPSVYKTNIQNFKDVDFSLYENVSLTIYVTAGTNSGTNSYTVKLIDKDGNQVSTYSSTKTNGMGSGSNASSAKESSVTFSPSTAFTGYRIDFNPKAFITQTRYVLTYDDKASSCSNTVTLATGNPTNGTISFSPTGPVETCDGNVNVTMTITPNAGYYLSAYSKSGVNTSNTPSIATGTSAKTAQTPTLTFAQNTNGTYTAGATFTAFVDHFIDEVQNSTGYTGEGMAKSGNYSNSLPTIADKTVATTGNCQALHYHFVGWVISDYKDSPTGHIATLDGHATGATYYAVWAKQGESGDITDEITRAKVVGANSNIGSNGNSSWATATLTGFSSGAQYFVRSMGLNNATNYAMRWNDNGYLYCSTAPSSGMKLKSVTVTTTANKNIGIYGATSKYSAKATATSLNTLSATSSGVTYNLTSAQLANNYTCVGINGTASSTEVVSISITYSNVAYTDYITQCCQELGSIKGSVFGTTHFGALSPEKFMPERP